MLDLTGASLIAYIRRIIEDVVSRSPRFRSTLGEVTHQYNNLIQWKDAQVTIKDVTAAGNRLSPDYFMTKQYGRGILAKVEGHEGQFVEWLQETDATKETPISGVYYLNVDSIDDKTGGIGLTVQTYRWTNGKIPSAQGSVVYLAQGIDGTTLSAELPDSGSPPLSPPISLVTAIGDGGTPPDGTDVLLFPHFLYLLTPTPAGLILLTGGSPPVPLTPMVDYWYQQNYEEAIVQSTVGGSEVANIPDPFISFTLEDETGYELQVGKDYAWYATNNWIELSEWTPPGSTITAKLVVKADPSAVPGTNPENILDVGLQLNETLASGQVFVNTPSGTYTSDTIVPNADGTLTLPELLMPGESAIWEVRIDAGQVQTTGRKFSTNEALIPGLRVAIGDNVVVGDQVAIIVSPNTCETYEVYGSKENLDFTVEVRANDLQTASDISEMLKQQLLVMRRENMEADGVTVFEARRSYHGSQRDLSGTAPQYTYTVSITAMADWKVYIPLVTRLVHLEIAETASAPGLERKLQLQPRCRAFGVTSFLQSYS